MLLSTQLKCEWNVFGLKEKGAKFGQIQDLSFQMESCQLKRVKPNKNNSH